MVRIMEATTFAARKRLAEDFRSSLPPDPLRGLICTGIQEHERRERPGSGEVLEIVEVEVWARKGSKYASCLRWPNGQIEWIDDGPQSAKRPPVTTKPVRTPLRIPAFGRRPR
jgi:hypothetical protein